MRMDREESLVTEQSRERWVALDVLVGKHGGFYRVKVELLLNALLSTVQMSQCVDVQRLQTILILHDSC